MAHAGSTSRKQVTRGSQRLPLVFLCAVLMLGLSFVPIEPVWPGATPASAKTNTEQLVVKTKTGRYELSVEVAETERQKALGLMFRTKVPPGTGMIFPYGSPQEITMWMRNTYVSLDMIFIRGDGTVHRVAEATVPMSEEIVASEGDVTAVLEVKAGEARRMGIEAGSKVLFRIFKP